MNSERLTLLTQQMLESKLNSQEFEELTQLLESSDEARQVYYELCEAHALLNDQFKKFPQPQSNDFTKTQSTPKTAIHFTWISSLVALLIIAFILNKPAANPKLPEMLSTPFRGIELAQLEKSIGVQFEYGNQQGTHIPAGSPIQEGSYELNQGIIQLNYKNQAQVIIEAPATFSLINDQKIHFSKGKVSVFAPPAAKGFTISTPIGDIVDLGTEFSTWVTPNNFVESHVYKGSVQANLNDGQTRNVKAGQATRILFDHNEDNSYSNLVFVDIDLRSDFFIRRLNEPKTAYSKLITQLNPAVYFPMEMSSDGQTVSDWSSFKNDASANNLSHKDNLLTPGTVGNALSLSGSNHRGYLYVADYPKSQFNELSVSAWVYARSRPYWATIIKNWGHFAWGQFHFGLNPRGNLDAEFMTNDHEKVHVTSKDKFILDTWQHVAFVHTGLEVTLYLNGQIVAQSKVNGINPQGQLRSLGIGTKISDQDKGKSDSIPGHWDGYLDEVAIFNHALEPDQIQELYNLANN